MPEEDVKVLPLDPGPMVLVVSNEPDDRSILRRMVWTLGYPARSCRSGREALRFLKANPRAVRLLMTDLAMPRMDGGELAERALDLDPSLLNPGVQVDSALSGGLIPGEVANPQKLTIGETFTIVGAIFLAAAWRPR
jgi:CheY-like chemotaxis protein